MKYKVVDEFRFFTFIAFLISLMIILSLTFRPNDDKFLENFEIVEVFVKSGDISWNIQKRLAPSYDVRKTLRYAEDLNGKSMGNIIAGDTVYFLKEKE